MTTTAIIKEINKLPLEKKLLLVEETLKNIRLKKEKKEAIFKHPGLTGTNGKK